MGDKRAIVPLIVIRFPINLDCAQCGSYGPLLFISRVPNVFSVALCFRPVFETRMFHSAIIVLTATTIKDLVC